MSITIESGSSTPGLEPSRRLALWVGIAVLGLAVAVGLVIQAQVRDPSPPEGVPREIAIPALYATMGLLAVIGALQRRAAIVVAAGVLCFVGAILSVATIEFVVPGILLIGLGARIQGQPARPGREAAIAMAAVVLIVGAGAALLSITEERCWTATGSPAALTYTVMPCASQAGFATGGSTFASGSDSGVLTIGGGLSEAVLLAAALTLTALTGRTRSSERVLA